MNDTDLSTLIQAHADRHPASSSLKAKVQTQIALYAVAKRQEPLVSMRRRGLGKLFSWWDPALGKLGYNASRSQVRSLAVSFLSGVILTVTLVSISVRLGTHAEISGALAAELTNLHVRSMGVGPLYQVASSDRHTVKPWFQGKLDYAPEVPDLHDTGYELLGGRVDRVQGQNTAVLSYQLRKHFISAFVTPATQVVPLTQLQQRGFSLVHWSDGIMQVWAVTDAEGAELERFGNAWRSKVSAKVSIVSP